MNYEKELEYLRRELKKSTEKYNEAVAEGHERYAEIWSDDILDIKFQIHVYEQATKADKYEANLEEVKKQLQTEIQLAKRSGNNAEELAFYEALDIIEKINMRGVYGAEK